MAYDEGLAQRVREATPAYGGVTERRMFGGLAFMSGGLVFVGILGDRLMARVGPEAYPDMLAKPHVKEMDFTDRPMKGYVFVEPAGYESDEALTFWLNASYRFVASLPTKKPSPRRRRGSAAERGNA